MMAEEKEKLRKTLSKESDLDEKEIEAILAAYAQQMAKLEHKIGVERARQIAVCVYACCTLNASNLTSI